MVFQPSVLLQWWSNGTHEVDIIFATLAIAWLVWMIKRLRPGKFPLPPGPRGLPFIGSLLSLQPELHLCFSKLARTYGPIVKLQLGNKLCIIVSSESLAKEVLKDNGTSFATREVLVSSRIASYNCNDIVWSPYGPNWRMLRKVCVRELLNNSRIDAFRGVRQQEVQLLLRQMYAERGTPVNLSYQIVRTIFNIVTNILWGGRMKGEEENNLCSEFHEVAGEILELLAKPNVSDFFPFLAQFDVGGVERQMKSLMAWFNRIFDELLDERLETCGATGERRFNDKGSGDFLDILLQIKEKGDPKMPLTMVHVKAVLLDMVVAGTDTTSTTLEWAMTRLVQNPEIMKKVQDELETVVGQDNIVDESHLHKFHYLDAVVKETLRLHPAIPLLIPRTPTEPCTVGGYKIPEGASVWVNIWAVHRDPTTWENPSEFYPERFLHAKTNWDYSGSDFNYFPFGSGRRICAGISLAEKMVNYMLASFLHSFNWQLPQGTKLELSERFGVVLKKANPLIVIPTPRTSNTKRLG